MSNGTGDSVWVITGASAGIGAALAHEVASRGARVVLVARRADKLAEVAAGIDATRAECVVGDVTNREDHARVLERAIERFGRVDVWVNNAGRGITRSIEQLGDDDVDAMMRDNFKSVLYGMQTAVPYFKQRGAGTVCNVSSMLSRTPLAPFRAAYSASKAAVNSLTESLRFELAKDYPNIRVVLALPGVVTTDFGRNALHGGPDSRGLPGSQSAEEVARAFADGIAAGHRDVYTRPEALDRVLGYLKGLAAAT